MRKVAIIQARMSSSRLFGKVMLPLGDTNVLGQVIRRVKLADVDDIVVATSEDKLDDHIISFCKKNNINTYRGSLTNVLERYYYAAETYKADIVIRITSDCPLYDPHLLNTMLAKFKDCDYFTTALTRTFPRGIDIEIFTFTALEEAYRKATKDTEFEHVTPYIYHNRNVFNCKNYENDINLAGHRWTLDTKEDYIMINSIYEHLGNNATTTEIVNFLQLNPHIYTINNHIKQKVL
jgi:spore coat polysaccharide biosynthesis protein SpsF